MSQSTPPFRSKNPPCRTQPTQLTQLSLYICVYARSFLITDRIIFKNINNRKKLCRVARLCRRQGSRSPFHPSEAARHPDFSLHSSGSIHKTPSSKKFSSIYMSKIYPRNLPLFRKKCHPEQAVRRERSRRISTFLHYPPPHKDPWKKRHPPPLCKSSFFGKSHPTHMFFLLLSQQKRRLRFRNLLWSSFIPSGSLMISPDPPVHNCTLLYGTVRFTKKERFSRSSPYLSDKYNYISRTICIQVILCAFMCIYVLYFRKKSGNRRCRT